MGLFNIFNKKKSEVEKIEHKVPEHYGTTSELLDEVENLALRYLINDNMLDTYNKEKLDIKYINEARAELEKAIKELNKSLEEYYDNEYSAVGNTKESNKNFPYSLEALVAIFNNSLDLYSDDENTWDTLNLAYNKCNHKLNKVKEVLSDNEAIQEFTGLKPIEKEEVKEEKVKEDNVKTKGEFEIDLGAVLAGNKKLNIDGIELTITVAQANGGDALKDAIAAKLTDYEVTVDDPTDGKKITLTQKKASDKESMRVSFDGKAQTVKVETKGLAAKAEEVSEGKAHVQVGANAKQSMSIEIGDMRAEALGIKDDAGNSLSVKSAEDANKAIEAFDAALNAVSSQRANLGAVQNRLEYTISNLDNTAENLTSAESTLRDVDMASEMMEYSKNNILNQAAQAMISQANQQPQNVLQLLR